MHFKCTFEMTKAHIMCVLNYIFKRFFYHSPTSAIDPPTNSLSSFFLVSALLSRCICVCLCSVRVLLALLQGVWALCRLTALWDVPRRPQAWWGAWS